MLTLTSALLPVLALAAAAPAASPAATVDQGNQLYHQGQYADALTRYASDELPDPNDPVVLYNRANCLFKTDQPDQAIELYRQAAAGSKDTQLVARARYNLGNCHMARASDMVSPSAQTGQTPQPKLQDVLTELTTAVAAYRAALEINPDDPDTRHNIAVARLHIKNILDQIKKQQALQQAAEQRRQLAEKIKKLLERQLTLLEETNAIAETASIAAPTEIAKQCSPLEPNQIALTDDTAEVRDQAAEMVAQHPTQPQPITQADLNDPNIDPMLLDRHIKQTVTDELTEAVGHQQIAAQQFRAAEPALAGQSENSAAENLKRALQALGQDDQQQQQQCPNPQQGDNSEQQTGQGQQKDGQDQQQQNQDQQQDNKEQQDQQQGDKDQKDQPNDSQSPDQQQAQNQEQINATAQAILDQEKEDRARRRRLFLGGHKPVEKDW